MFQVRSCTIIFLLFFFCEVAGSAQNQNAVQGIEQDKSEETPPEQVDIEPTADDEQIQQRLKKILISTGWYTGIVVQVNDGVVFLEGEAETEEQKVWAGNLARNTQDVTAVVNRIAITTPDIWNYEPAINNVRELWQNILRSTPTIVFALIVLLFFWGFSLLVSKAFRGHLKRRRTNPLLQEIISKTVAVAVFLIGIYVIFYIADLTRVALTVLGGTGLLGIILGIAFRDITENFLASVFLSMQHPFENGDMIEITGYTGYVQRMTIRATLLLTLDGNHMQIPNSTVYKSNIINYTSNPNQRNQFTIRIAYNDNITQAQEVGRKILEEHPAVLKEPEPWVLVDELAPTAIVVRFYYWVDGIKHNPLKVNSSIRRLVKKAYQEAGISMPDEVVQVVFPKGVPSQNTLERQSEEEIKKRRKTLETATSHLAEEASTKAEGGLKNNAEEIKKQAQNARIPEEGEDLLNRKSDDNSSA